MKYIFYIFSIKKKNVKNIKLIMYQLLPVCMIWRVFNMRTLFLIGLALTSQYTTTVNASEIERFTNEEDFPQIPFEEFRHKRFTFARDDSGESYLIIKEGLEDKYLASILKAISKWKVQLGEPKNSDTLPNPVQENILDYDGATAYNVTEYLPKVAKAFNMQYFVDGPNCWNMVALTNGHTQLLRMMNDDSFTELLNTPFSLKIENETDIRPGDVMAYRYRTDSGFLEVHGAIYLTENLVWTKNGPRESKPVRLMDADEVHGIYLKEDVFGAGETVLPRKCTKPKSYLDKDCKVYVEYFRLDSNNYTVPKAVEEDALKLSSYDFATKFYEDIEPFFSYQEIPSYSESISQNIPLTIKVAEKLIDTGFDYNEVKHIEGLSIEETIGGQTLLNMIYRQYFSHGRVR